jgi:hypothetical protein
MTLGLFELARCELVPWTEPVGGADVLLGNPQVGCVAGASGSC